MRFRININSELEAGEPLGGDASDAVESGSSGFRDRIIQLDVQLSDASSTHREERP